MKAALLSAGAPRHGRNITQQWQHIADDNGFGWQLDFLEWKTNAYDDYDFGSYDWCIWVGCFERVFEFMGQIQGPRHAALWVGTDLLQHGELVSRGYPDPFSNASIHIADATNLQVEAAQLTGLDVGLVRSIPPVCYAPTPIARWSDVLGYVPTHREEFFRYQWFLDLARDYPSLTFHLLGRSDATKPEGVDNVVFEPEVSGEDKRRLFESVFCYLRPIEHDGIGLTAIEAFQLGRHVFHSDTRIPYTTPARSVGEIEFGLDRILQRKAQLPAEASSYYLREYNERRLAEDLSDLRSKMEQVK